MMNNTNRKLGLPFAEVSDVEVSPWHTEECWEGSPYPPHPAFPTVNPQYDLIPGHTYYNRVPVSIE